MQKFLLSVLILGFSWTSFADDAWLTCLNNYVSNCNAQGWTTQKIYICNDWDGSNEACIQCLKSGTIELFAGCGGPGYASLSNNLRKPQCTKNEPGNSVINVTNNNFSETIPLTGSSLSLVFSSDRGLRRQDDYRINFPLYNSTPTTFTTVTGTIDVAGQHVLLSYPVASSQSVDWTWNGKDNSGNTLPGGAIASITLNFSTTPSPVSMSMTIPVGNWKVDLLGLGGWSLSNNHFYDVSTGKLFMGDGTSFEADYETLADGSYAVSRDSDSEVYVFNTYGEQTATWAALTGKVLETFTYNSSGQLLTATDAYGRTTTFNRNSSGVLTSITTPDGVITTVSVNTAGYLGSVTNPNSKIYSMTYSSTGMLATFTKPAGEVSTYTVDTYGNLTKDAHNGGPFLQLVAANSGDTRNFTQTSAVGRTELFSVLSTVTSSKTQSTDSLGVVSTSTEIFGPTGSVTNVTGNTSQTTTFTQDPRFGDLVQQISTIAEVQGTLTRNSTMSHSATLSDTTNPFSITTLTHTNTVNTRAYTSAYTGSTMTWKTTSPKGRTTSVIQDVYQKPTSVQSGSLTPVTFGYDTYGRLSTMTQGTRVTQYAYNTSGYLSKITNPLSQATSYTYTPDGYVWAVTLPDTRVIGYTYDGDGRLTGVTPPGKTLHSLMYTVIETLQEYLPPVLGGVAKPIKYVYNNDKQMIEADRPDGVAVHFNYDATKAVLNSIATTSTLFSYTYETTKGLLQTALSSASGFTNTFAYNGTLLAGDTLASGTTQVSKVTPSYDANFWMSGLSIQGTSSSTAASLTFTRDTDGLVTNVGGAVYAYQTATPLLSTITLGHSVETWAYSTLGEVSSRTTTNSGAAAYAFSFTRDALGRVATKTKTIGTTSHVYGYTYDTTGRLTDVTKDSVAYSHYAYDTNNNRTGGNVAGVTTSGTYDAQDRLTAYNGLTFTYNDNGERTKQTVTATSANTVYAYNELGQLTQVTLPSGSIITYIVDGLGRLVQRKLNGTVTNTYLYNGSQVVGDLTTAGLVNTQYIYVAESSSPDIMIRGGIAYKLIKDQLGSIHAVQRTTDGVIVEALEYDEFGNVLSDTSPGFQPFGFAGGIYDSSAGLVHFGARDYDPYTGRFVSKDPLLFGGGSTNLYSYAINDPVNFTDPTGLKVFDPQGLIPDWIKQTPFFKQLDSDIRPIFVRSGNLGGDFGLTSSAAFGLEQVITIDKSAHDPNAKSSYCGKLSDYEDTVLHELYHSSQNLNRFWTGGDEVEAKDMKNIPTFIQQMGQFK